MVGRCHFNPHIRYPIEATYLIPFQTLANAPPAEEKAHGSITMATYYCYFRAGGSYLFLLLIFVVFIMGEVCHMFPCMALVQAQLVEWHHLEAGEVINKQFVL